MMNRRFVTAAMGVCAALMVSFQPAPRVDPRPICHPDTTAAVADAAAFLIARNGGLDSSEILEVAHAVVAEARRRSLDPELVLAVIDVESSGRYDAVSPVGALGLMQILPSTGEAVARGNDVHWTGPKTLFDPVVNVRLGVAYLAKLLDRYGALPTALTAYNWGPTRISTRIRRGDPLPLDYANKVLRTHARAAGQAT